MPKYQMSTLEPVDDEAVCNAIELYEDSEDETIDALEWAMDTRPTEVVAAAVEAFRESDKWSTAIEDIAAGEREVTPAHVHAFQWVESRNSFYCLGCGAWNDAQ